MNLILRIDVGSNALGWVFEDEQSRAGLRRASQKNLALVTTAEQADFVFGVRGRYPKVMNALARGAALFCMIDNSFPALVLTEAIVML